MSTARSTAGSTLWVGLAAALASSLCCITPVLAALAGVGSLAGAFHWIAPARPYLLGLTVLALGYAWYLKLRPRPAEDCGCEVPAKPRFFQRTGFLVGITLFAAVTSAFPLFSQWFYPSKPTVSALDQGPVQRIVINVKGMTCEGCEHHVGSALQQVPGVKSANASFKEGTAEVTFDPTVVNYDQLKSAIDSTGYTAIGLNTTTP
jgi:copper chaperone CopZ